VSTDRNAIPKSITNIATMRPEAVSRPEYHHPVVPEVGFAGLLTLIVLAAVIAVIVLAIRWAVRR
jgi:hypothetical protein